MRRQLLFLALAALGVLSAGGVLLYSCNHPPDGIPGTDSNQIRSSEGILGSTTAYRSANDPGNPYADQYKDWDRWVFNHLTDWKSATAQESDSPSFRFITVYLDKRGFVLPQLEEERQKRELIKAGSDESLDDLFQCTSFAAVGEMEDTMWSAMESAIDMLVEPYFPPIPEWVASALPRKAILLPEGYVAALDGLGSWSPADTGESNCHCGPTSAGPADLVTSTDGSRVLAREPEHWYLYDPSGRVLDDGPMGWWMLMYRSKHGDQWPAGMGDTALDGYTELTDTDSGEVISAWGWDANQTQPGVDPAPRDRHYFRILDAAQLKRILEIRKLGQAGGNGHV